MSKAFDSAVRLLSRREYGAVELCEKLKQKGYSLEERQEALAACQRLDLQNDKRFVEVYCRSRIRQGYGPLKINQELNNKGIDHEVTQQALQEEQDNWLVYALKVWQKRNKNQHDWSFDELQKQQRFLLYRGFSMDTITLVKKELDLC